MCSCLAFSSISFFAFATSSTRLLFSSTFALSISSLSLFFTTRSSSFLFLSSSFSRASSNFLAFSSSISFLDCIAFCIFPWTPSRSLKPTATFLPDLV
ncbi:unnamed protein product [Closterium sp. NIES-54]